MRIPSPRSKSGAPVSHPAQLEINIIP